MITDILGPQASPDVTHSQPALFPLNGSNFFKTAGPSLFGGSQTSLLGDPHVDFKSSHLTDPHLLSSLGIRRSDVDREDEDVDVDVDNDDDDDDDDGDGCDDADDNRDDSSTFMSGDGKLSEAEGEKILAVMNVMLT